MRLCTDDEIALLKAMEQAAPSPLDVDPADVENLVKYDLVHLDDEQATLSAAGFLYLLARAQVDEIADLGASLEQVLPVAERLAETASDRAVCRFARMTMDRVKREVPWDRDSI